MPRKKKGETMDNGTALDSKPGGAQPESNGVAGNGHTEPTASASARPEKPKPLVSWRLMSDRSTSIELAVWSNMLQGPDGEYEQLSCTASRSYKDQYGKWYRGGSWRIHDIPVLQFLLTKAHTFGLERRTTTDNNGLPF
jgi:hypothetical protein